MNLRSLPLAVLPLLAASCNVQESAPSSAPDAVILAPRFAGTTTVPATDSVTVVLETESGEHDTSLTEAYFPGKQVSLGTLPPGVRFSIAMTGWANTAAGTKVATWWTSALDSSGSDAVRKVTLPVPQQAETPVASFSLIVGSFKISGSDTVFFQGKPIRLPAGTWITKDGTDPRTSASADSVDTLYMTDSVSAIRVAVKLEADTLTGRPALWSPVKELKLEVDPLDTLTSLDTLFLSTYDKFIDTLDSDSIKNPIIQAPSPVDTFRIDSLDHVWFDPASSNPSTLHLYVSPASSRATITTENSAVAIRTFTAIPFPEDSTLEVVVRNHGRTRTFTVKFAKAWPDSEYHLKVLRDLKSPSPGLVESSLDDFVYSIVLPTAQDSLLLVPTFDSTLFLKIGDILWRSGDSIRLQVGQGSSSIVMDMVNASSDAAPGRYVLQVSHEQQLAFLDTTNGVAWRNVAYDTLVDARNSIKYRTVVVGKARWMAENLRYKRDSVFCYSGIAENCTKYGRLYRWAASADTTPDFDYASLAIPSGHVKGACPIGWHLPTHEEWQDLLTTLGAESASNLLRSTGDSWTLGGGQDTVGLRVLPAGRRFVTLDTPRYQGLPYSTFENLGTDAWFWTSTQSSLDGKDAVALRISQTTQTAAFETTTRKSGGLSVRCVSDTAVVAP